MRRRNVLAGAVTAGVAVLVGVLVANPVGSDDDLDVPGGPLLPGASTIGYTAFDTMHRRDYRVGETFTDGMLGYIEFDTDEPVTITSVEPVGGGPALKYLGAVVVPTPRHGYPYAGFDTAPGFPVLDPPVAPGRVVTWGMWATLNDPEPAEGAVLEPAMWAGRLVNRPMLLLGWKLLAQERTVTDGVRI